MIEDEMSLAARHTSSVFYTFLYLRPLIPTLRRNLPT